MYYIIDIERFTVVRGPFIRLEQAQNVLAELKSDNCYIVQAIE